MIRRIGLCALVLLATIPLAASRRRTVTPGRSPVGPGPCGLMGVLTPGDIGLIAGDADSYYWVDDSTGGLNRISRNGGEATLLSNLEGWFPLSMTVDETSIYIGALPFEAIFSPRPGSILVLPKSGGTLATLFSGVPFPSDIEVDATHLYWVALGTVDFQAEEILPDGKIERGRKDGSGRQQLAHDLAAPVDLAIEGDTVWFGESGQAVGNDTVGISRVAKDGGAVTAIDRQFAVIEIGVVPGGIVAGGGTSTIPNAIVYLTREGTNRRVLAAGDDISDGPVVRGDRVYYATGTDESGKIMSVEYADPQQPRIEVESDHSLGLEFEVDDCAITYSTNGEIRRKAR